MGIELDSLTQQAHLPQNKFDEITALLEEYLQRRWCKHKELESLMGHLSYSCKDVLQGCCILRQMINLLHCDDQGGVGSEVWI